MSLHISVRTQTLHGNLARKAISRVPQVTLGFWLIKIVATTLGETGGDWVTMSLNLGYVIGTLIFTAIFIALALQRWL